VNSNRLDQNFLKTLTVLYVEDDTDTRQQFSEFLRRPVGTLITAANGVEGLAAFKKHRPDIVVTDVLMPLMDGLTMAQEILSSVPSVPIIVITAFEQTDYLLRAINIGIDKFVTKPVNSYLMFECLLECVHRLRGEEQLKLQHQRDIEEVWSKHHKIVAGLAGGIAHDYNNMMQGILGYASLAKNEPDREKATQYLEMIEHSSGDAKKLGRMLRILGKDYGENMQRGPLMSFIQLLIKNILVNSTITLTLEYPDTLPDVTYFEHQMELVFSSLATNATEAMPTGGTLHLAAQVLAVSEDDIVPLEVGNYLHITLTDSGTGIAPEILPHIFDPYFSTKQRGTQRGMGLSLALCHTIVLRQGGLITAESTPGNGSTFHIWLPLDG
jgi:signal transduction histidine kinase